MKTYLRFQNNREFIPFRFEAVACKGVITSGLVVEKPHVWGLFKNVQMQGAQKIKPRGV